MRRLPRGVQPSLLPEANHFVVDSTAPACIIQLWMSLRLATSTTSLWFIISLIRVPARLGWISHFWTRISDCVFMISPWYPHRLVSSPIKWLLLLRAAPRSRDEEATRASNSPYGGLPLGIPEINKGSPWYSTQGFWMILDDFLGNLWESWLDLCGVLWAFGELGYSERCHCVVSSQFLQDYCNKGYKPEYVNPQCIITRSKSIKLHCLSHDISWLGLRN